MRFDAWNTYEKVKKQYVDFLLDNSMGAFPEIGHENQWQEQREQLQKLWFSGDRICGLDSLFADPLVDFSFPYMDDENGTLDALCAKDKATDSSPLHPGLVSLLKKTNMKDWIFKNHQVESFQKSIDHENKTGNKVDAKTIIVSSGTGSGKTESFLIPMLNKMFWEEDEESLAEPGVRVLIIYPMNALVNNQLQRLHDLLGEDVQENIKFGFYTSRLKDQLTSKQLNAMKSSTRKLYEDANFIKDRKALRERPPHILVTNYSMLELMLIRPKDNSIFSNKLQTIVLDEAHVYSGALGTDVSLLLRRTADRFGTDMKAVTGIATSATLDNTKDALMNLQKFGAQLFSKDVTEVECITGRRKELLEISGKFSGVLPLKPLSNEECYWLLEFNPEKEVTSEDSSRLKNLLYKAGVIPDENVEIGSSYEKFLYDAFGSNESLKDLRKEFYQGGNPGPRHFKEVKELISGLNGSYLLAVAFLSLFTKAFSDEQDSDYFLPGKLHTFIRSPYKLWSDLQFSEDFPLGKLYDNNNENGLQFPIYVSGNIRRDFYFKAKFSAEVNPETLDKDYILVEPGKKHGNAKDCFLRFFNESVDSESSIRFRLDFKDNYLEIIEDDCGPIVFAIEDTNTVLDEVFNEDIDFKTIDGKKIVQESFFTPVDEFDEKPEVSLAQLGGISKDIIDSILAESLLPHLPNKDVEKTADGRGTLIFADNRQGAAWRATYIQDGYNKNVIRNFIYKAALRGRQDATSSGATALDDSMIAFLKAKGMYEKYLEEHSSSGANEKIVTLSDIISSLSKSTKFEKEIPLVPELEKEREKEEDRDFWRQCVEAYVHRELLIPRMQTRNLESMGFLRAYYKDEYIPKLNEKEWSKHPFLGSVYHNEEWKALWPAVIAQIYDFMRMAGAIEYTNTDGSYKNYTKPYNEIHAAGRHVFNKYYLKQINGKGKREEMGFLTALNIRKYCERIIELCGLSASRADLDVFLENIFDILVCSKPEILSISFSDDLSTIAINPDKLAFVVLDDDSKIEFHSHAYRIRLKKDHDANVSTRTSIGGQYHELNDTQEQHFEKSRDFELYTKEQAHGIKASEHTAQLTADQLKDIESKFNNGEVNLLCCSTTMELGIDLDGLVSVVLGNLPPEPSNYIQRAGRAGRRNDSSSIVLTVLRQNPYDLSVFDNSKLLYDRVMKLGHIRFDDRRIIERHVFAFILTDFFKVCCNVTKNRFRSPLGSWSDLQSFFGYFEENKTLKGKAKDYEEIMQVIQSLDFYNNSCESMYDLFKRYLRNLNGRLDESISSIISGTYYSDSSVDDLIAILEDRFEKEFDNYQETLDAFSEQEKVCRASGNEKGIGAIGYQKVQFLNQPLVTYLAKELVIPRYGFPVDIIDLKTKNQHTNPYDKNHKDFDGAELSRGLEMALSQYSPGCEVVVNHQVFKSEGISIDSYQPEASAIQKKYFIICKSCGSFSNSDADILECKSCGHPTSQGIDQGREHEGLECAPTKVKHFFVPRSFSISYSEGPQPANEKLHYDQSKGYSCVSVNTNENELVSIGQVAETSLKYAYLQDHDLFFFNGGLGARIVDRDVRGRGYCVCLSCGYSLPETYESDLPKKFESHKVLYGTEHCPQHLIERNVILGGTSKADVMVFRMPHLALSNDVIERSKICETFKHALLLAGAEMLQADPRVLAAQLNHLPDSTDIILYDTSGSATGYLLELDQRRDELVLNAAKVLDCRKAKEDSKGHCEKACYNCLLNYSSAHDYKELDRVFTRKWWTAARKSLIGEGLKFGECKVQQQSLLSQLFRYDSKDVCLILRNIEADSLHNKSSLLNRLYKKSIKESGFNLKLIMTKSSLEKQSKLEGIDTLNTLAVWEKSSGFNVRVVDEVIQTGLFGKVNQTSFFSNGFQDDDYTQPQFYESGSWAFALESTEAVKVSQYIDSLWEKGACIEVPKLETENTTVRIEIPNGDDAHCDYLSEKVLDNLKLSLRNKISGKKVKRALYQDRYLIKAESIRNLANLLKDFSIDQNTDLRLITHPDSRNNRIYLDSVSSLLNKKTYHSLAHQNSSNSEFIHVANYLKRELGCKTEILLLTPEAKGTSSNPGWEGEQHGRQLLIEFDDSSGLVMLFDLGMSWASPEESISSPHDPGLPIFHKGRKYVTQKSYVLATTELTEHDKGLWDLTSSVPPEFGEFIDEVLERPAVRI